MDASVSARSEIRLRVSPGTYTESDVPITIRASTLLRSASNDRLTLSCKASPKKVTPGLSTPPHAPSLVVNEWPSRCRFLIRALTARLGGVGERVDFIGYLIGLGGSRHRGIVPFKTWFKISLESTRCLHLTHVAHCSEP